MTFRRAPEQSHGQRERDDDHRETRDSGRYRRDHREANLTALEQLLEQLKVDALIADGEDAPSRRRRRQEESAGEVRSGVKYRLTPSQKADAFDDVSSVATARSCGSACRHATTCRSFGERGERKSRRFRLRRPLDDRCSDERTLRVTGVIKMAPLHARCSSWWPKRRTPLTQKRGPGTGTDSEQPPNEPLLANAGFQGQASASSVE